MRTAALRFTLLVAAIAASSCGGGTSNTQQPQASNAGAPAASRGNTSVNKADYPVFPNADAGADPSVPAEQGGKGFKGDGWQTNTDYELIGDPRAVRGGTFREYELDFPSTLRVYGPEANTILNLMIQSTVYEQLLYLHSNTLDYIPGLATHWQISPDQLTYRFRLDPNARFSDGEPVVADDVVASWSMVMDKGLQDPMNTFVFGKFEKPVAESKYIVRVKTKSLNWRNFIYFAQALPIFPSHILKNVDGAAYVKDYNFKLLPGTGPYEVRDADVIKGKSITIRRRNNYWADKIRRNIGQNNFDGITEVVVRDQKLAVEMFKKGDLDFYPVSAREWIEEFEKLDRIDRGLIQKRKVFNELPLGTLGLAFNTRKAPYDDVRLREAMAHLLNRKLMIEKLFYNEYVPINSYFAGTPYENPNNPKVEYDPQLAVKLLADAGWKDHDAQGRLTKNGQPLSIELLYATKPYEPALTTYQEDLRKVGISLNLRFITPETLFTLMDQRKFDLILANWGGLLFPNPETQFASSLADSSNSNNITGFKNKRVDELLPIYDKEFNQARRVAIIREIDGIVANSHEYILMWEAPYTRIAYWNKFGMPDGYFTRFNDYHDIPTLWWIDPDKDAALKRTMGDNAAKLPVGATEVHFWDEYSKQHPVAESEGFAGKK
ncbi:MAG TPA: extracellular solute-binding protein [Vicinamibacterales bacterium]|nr:extracellular solute-binding protein [Vicinamibacterales bacterium]